MKEEGLLNTRATENTKISVIVVYYELDVPMACLLSRSLEIFLDPELVTEIIFVNNFLDEESGRDAFEGEILGQFKSLRPITRCVRIKDVSNRDELDGYVAQQALKLEIGRIIENPFYLVLDTKNHLVLPVNRSSLFSKNGLPRSNWANHTGYLRTCLNSSAEFFNLKIEDDAKTLPTVTPFVMNTNIVCALLKEIENRGWASVYDLIVDNDKRTEFLLYYSFIESNFDVESVYTLGPPLGTTLFARWPQDSDVVEKLLDSVGIAPAIALGIHSRRFGQLSFTQSTKLAGIWHRTGLFPSIDDGLDMISLMASRTGETTGSTKESSSPVSSNSTEPNTRDDIVLVGRNGRLFINEGSNSPLKQHAGDLLLSSQQVRDWRRILDVRRAYCTMHGIRYAMMVAPDTHAIYREDVPSLDTRDSLRPIQQIQSQISKKAPFFYPLKELKAAKARGHVCHSTDSHWSGFGAFVAYVSLMQAIDLSSYVLDESDVERFDREGSGDLGDKFDPVWKGHYTECVVQKPFAEKIWDNGVSNRGYIGHWKNQKQELPRAVLFMDSYGWKFLRFFSESFSELVAVHTPFFEWDVIEHFHPNVVVSLMAERFLIKPPYDFHNESALVTAQKKGGIQALPDWLRG